MSEPLTNPAERVSGTRSYHADVQVMLKRAISDPQGRAVLATLRRLGHHNITDVRVGKHLELTLSGEHAEVEAQLGVLIAELLSNPVIEEAHYSLTEIPVTEIPVTEVSTK